MAGYLLFAFAIVGLAAGPVSQRIPNTRKAFNLNDCWPMVGQVSGDR